MCHLRRRSIQDCVLNDTPCIFRHGSSFSYLYIPNIQDYKNILEIRRRYTEAIIGERPSTKKKKKIQIEIRNASQMMTVIYTNLLEPFKNFPEILNKCERISEVVHQSSRVIARFKQGLEEFSKVSRKFLKILNEWEVVKASWETQTIISLEDQAWWKSP